MNSCLKLWTRTSGSILAGVSAPLAVLATFAGLAAHQAHAGPGDIHNLGTLGGEISEGWGINASGQVAGYSYTTDNNEAHAFRYDGIPGSGGIMHDLGALGSPGDSSGYAINYVGQVVGDSTSSDPDDFSYHAFRYEGTPGSGGDMHDLGALSNRRDSGASATGINDAGQVSGYSDTRGEDDPVHAFRYDGAPGSVGVMHDLGTLSGEVSLDEDDFSVGAGINSSGQVVGTSATPDDFLPHAFRYDGTPGNDGIMHDLGTLPGGSESWGNGINASGQVVGSADGLDFGSHAFRYDGTPGVDGVMHDLGTLGGQFSEGYAINDAGYVVGVAQQSDDSGGYYAPVLWLPDSTVVDLDSWLDAVNPVVGGYWSLTEARGINSAGLITGSGEYYGPDDLEGGTRAFVLDASSLVPEPTSFFLLAMGLLLLGWGNLRRLRAGGMIDAH